MSSGSRLEGNMFANESLLQTGGVENLTNAQSTAFRMLVVFWHLGNMVEETKERQRAVFDLVQRSKSLIEQWHFPRDSLAVLSCDANANLQCKHECLKKKKKMMKKKTKKKEVMDATKAEVQLDDISWHTSRKGNNSANHFPGNVLLLVRGSGRSFWHI